MKFNELEQGKIYVTDIKNPGYMFKCIGDCTIISYTDSFSYWGTRGNLNAEENPSFSDYREATAEEVLWWEACNKARKIVPRPVFDYSIY